jgi:Plasmid pRiA4b ORF-3-like protein
MAARGQVVPAVMVIRLRYHWPRLHRGERCTYVDNFHDHWVCELQIEALRPVDPRRSYPVCTGGKRAAPPEGCGGAWAYMQLVAQHHIPLAAMSVVATALERLLQADGQTSIRQVIGDRATFREAVEQFEAYLQFRPEQFDRGQVNAQFAGRKAVMKYTIQVVITTDDGQTETRELASLEREHLSPTTLGLTLAEGKTLLKALQEIVVKRQLTAYLATQRPCAHCGTLQHSKGYHTTQVRTVFGTIPVHSLRLHHCPCQPQTTKTFSPLAVLLPEPTTPELLFLETKWAALVSYGVTAQLLHEVLPIDDRWPHARFGSMSSPSRNAWSKPWERSSGRSSTAVPQSGAAYPSPMAR